MLLLRLVWPLVALLRAARSAAVAAGPACPPHTTCVLLYSVNDNFSYKVDNKTLSITFDPRSYMLTCPKNVTLDNTALPRFVTVETFQRVKLVGCGIPATGLAAALAALGVRPADSLELARVPPGPVLAAPLFEGLPMPVLQIDADWGTMLQAAQDFLLPLPQLRDLRLTGVVINPATLFELPTGLKSLWLSGAQITDFPKAALERLADLRRLFLMDKHLAATPDLTATPKVSEILLDGPVDGLVVGPAVENATLRNVKSATIGGECVVLKRLIISNVTERPPAHWLAGCPQLQELRLDTLPAGALATDVLQGVSALRKLVVHRNRTCCTARNNCNCSETVLAPKLLAHAPALRELDLSFSELRNLTSGLFGATLDLEVLDLSGNHLTADMIDVLTPFESLQNLSLARNPLGDLCSTSEFYISNDASPLRDMTALRSLELAEARLRRVCRDWRVQLLALQHLDLRYNYINHLQFDDLQWKQVGGIEVDLTGNSITTVHYKQEDYERSDSGITPPGVKIAMNARLTCDCRVYWFARAVQDAQRAARGRHALADARCDRTHLQISRVDPWQLQCEVPAALCAEGCACAVTGAASLLRCERHRLAALPRAAPALPPLADLRVAGNLIANLTRDDLPPHLKFLDLSDNQIKELDVDTANALFEEGERAVWLSGNPLACGCAQRAALGVLQAHPEQLRDARNVTCADGRALLALPLDALCAARDDAALAAALVGAMALALALLGLVCLIRPVSRRRIKKFLFDHNLCLRWVLRPSDDYVDDEDGVQYDYDAFISFSHHDEEFVIKEFVPGLEGYKYPRRLCLHYRDWTPGVLIVSQIMESVRRSRYTVVMLSENFLRSDWARAEFRAAHAAALRDARPRLVVVLLADLPPDLLDPELRDFLASNTYLRRGDPWFWSKLLDAIPRGRSRLPLPSAAPPALPPAPAAPAAPAAPEGLAPLAPPSSAAAA